MAAQMWQLGLMCGNARQKVARIGGATPHYPVYWVPT
jgi:hypothetical protein